MVQTYKSRLFFLVFSLNLFLPALLHRSQRDTGNPWLQYINSLTGYDYVREAAIYGIEDGLLYASSPGLANITPAQIQFLMSGDEDMSTSGVELGNFRCVILRDDWMSGGTIFVRTRDEPRYDIAITMSKTILVMVMGEGPGILRKLLILSSRVTDRLREAGL
ncbi:profilin-1-like [Genypterus blacodes]|uniref:profilin-1-like n=1 Tax=Genypterus blacodes TaxID=154954 RepID=UPI003F76EED6